MSNIEYNGIDTMEHFREKGFFGPPDFVLDIIIKKWGGKTEDICTFLKQLGIDYEKYRELIHLAQIMEKKRAVKACKENGSYYVVGVREFEEHTYLKFLNNREAFLKLQEGIGKQARVDRLTGFPELIVTPSYEFEWRFS